MNFLEIPSCYDCIVKIKYGSTFSYLRMNLSNLRKVRSKFKNHLTCWILAFGNIYTWVQIEDAYLDTEYITCRKHTTNILGIRLFHPIDEKMPFVTLPKNFFKPLTEKQWALSLYATSNFEFSVRNRYGRKAKDVVSADMYFGPRRLDHTSDKWFINDILLDQRSFLDIDSVMSDYIDNYFTNTIDVYLTHILLKANILTPLALAASSNIYRCPKEIYWMFQLLYGRDNYVYFHLDKDRTIGFSDIKIWKRWKKKVKSRRFLV